eukprot:Seg1092.4 transcript_id=Seg1092.4/GoldUCD/mRNA.D3Y31 product="hypothetical protein" protein_id=Seg1092.4/GoldUCD/D3Y31
MPLKASRGDDAMQISCGDHTVNLHGFHSWFPESYLIDLIDLIDNYARDSCEEYFTNYQLQNAMHLGKSFLPPSLG